MAKALVIFNGLHFPYTLLDAGVKWAKENNAALEVVYLSSDEEKREGYIFPSDIELAEDLTDDADVDKDNQSLINNQSKLAQHSADAEGVTCNTQWLVNSTEEEIIELASTADIVFLDGAVPEPLPILANESIDIQALAKKLSKPVQFVASY